MRKCTLLSFIILSGLLMRTYGQHVKLQPATIGKSNVMVDKNYLLDLLDKQIRSITRGDNDLSDLQNEDGDNGIALDQLNTCLNSTFAGLQGKFEGELWDGTLGDDDDVKISFEVGIVSVDKEVKQPSETTASNSTTNSQLGVYYVSYRVKITINYDQDSFGFGSTGSTYTQYSITAKGILYSPVKPAIK